MMKAITKLLGLIIGITILMSSCDKLEWFTTDDDVTPPSEVTNLKAEGLYKSIKLTWIDPEESDFEEIYITYHDYSVGNYTLFVKSGKQEIMIDSLQNKVEYTFLFQTTDDNGNYSNGLEIKATTIDPKYK